MTQNKIRNASQISQEIARETTAALQSVGDNWNIERGKTAPEDRVRVRGWAIVSVSGQSFIQIALDKGPLLTPGAPHVSLYECIDFHRFLHETPTLNAFDDNLGVEVGSPGNQPFLCSIEDFPPVIGQMINVECWPNAQERVKYVMILDSVQNDPGMQKIILREGVHLFEVEFSTIKFAKALLDHPETRVLPVGKKKSTKGPQAHKQQRKK